MTEEERLDPEALLEALILEEQKQKGGKLKIFFGMSAGVGKTYKMLEDAQNRAREGIDVVVGTINTHGRIETAKMLEGLKIIPEKWIKYKDVVFEELDIDEILRLKPQLVLIDELAHSNVPGSRHPKRWQDILEILDEGIDVYSTLNVQHVESLKDVVEGIAGIQIRETVPDLVLERASKIELVDIPPSELLQRLREGKVYLGDQSQIAAQNFFKEDRLTALREISLRFTAEKVDHELHGMLSQGISRGWKPRERLLVAVGPSPHSQQLIRAARRLAFELDAPWIAVNVDKGIILKDEDQLRLANNLTMAKDLGAEVITVSDTDVVAALQKISKQKNVSQILIGRSARNPFWDLFRENLINRLVNETTNVDIIIIRHDEAPYIQQKNMSVNFSSSPFIAYGITLLVGVIITILGKIFLPIIGYKAIGIIFLFSIFIASLFVGRGPIFFAALLSSLSWGFFFVPSRQADFEDIGVVILYIISALILVRLISQIKEKDMLLDQSEEKRGALFEIEKGIAKSTSFEQMYQEICSHLRAIYPGEFDILMVKADGQLSEDVHIPLLKHEKERAVALWVFEHGKVAGWSTDTLSSVSCIYFPIKGIKDTLGVLVYSPKNQRSLSNSEMNFLQTSIQQIGIFLQKIVEAEKDKIAEFSSQIEKMHKAIFQSFSRMFQLPLAKITKASQILQSPSIPPDARMKTIKQIEKSAHNVQRVVNNIITMSKSSSGFLHLQKEPHHINKLLESVLDNVESSKVSHSIELSIQKDLPLISFDFKLMELALTNLIINAIEYSPPNKSINIIIQKEGSLLKISVLDKGPGIPLKVLPLVFEKFYQVHVPGAHSEGIGLGLPVSKAIIELHEGTIEVKNRECGGVDSSLFLPL